MKKVTGTTRAWLGEYTSLSVLNGDDNLIIDNLILSSVDCAHHGWTFVGVAEITLNAIDGEEAIFSKIKTLKAMQQKVKADAHVKDKDLAEQIEKLLCITDQSHVLGSEELLQQEV